VDRVGPHFLRGQWKNGVITYALLNDLKNHGTDANKDQTITVSELQSYVIDQVRKLTEGGQSLTVRRENLTSYVPAETTSGPPSEVVKCTERSR
jgi:hypothetical protein